MPCTAPYLDQSIKQPYSGDLDIDSNDVKLNLQLLQKYFEVNTLDQTLVRHRNEFQTRTEHLQKRQEALHEREMMFKERIISYEMYIKELAMKRDRSLRRIEDEKNVLKIKQTEIDLLQKEIDQMHAEKLKLEKIIGQYQPHLSLLTQIGDRTDRFQSTEEMIEKFDMLYASYQDILMTMKTSNEELSDLQRQLLLTIEKKNSRIALMQNRIHQLEQRRVEIAQRIEKIQIEIGSYQQMSKEHLIDNGALKIAIESMFDLVRRYSHRSRKKELNLSDHSFVEKLKKIDTFLSDLVYYVDYVNGKQKKVGRPIEIIRKEISEEIEENNHWRGPCTIHQREALIKHEEHAYFSYKIRGEDDILYTIQMLNNDRKKTSQARFNRSSTSMIERNKEKKSNVLRTSTPKLQRSSDLQGRLSITHSMRTTFKVPSLQEKTPFSESERTSR